LPEWFDAVIGRRTPARLEQLIAERRKRVPTLTNEQVKRALTLVSGKEGFAWKAELEENEEHLIRALEKHGYLVFDPDLSLSKPTSGGLKAINEYLARLEKQD